MPGGGVRIPAALTPHRARVLARSLALALLIGVFAAGCGGDPDDRAGGSAGTALSTSPSSASGASSGSPRPLSGAELCVSAVGYWARETLDGGVPYGDYQSMGLSNRQYDILREVVAAARAAKREQGARAAGELIDRQVRRTCAERYRDGGPSVGPWQR
ncbi:hypothetical protein ACFYZ3_03475 [Streptomyces sp. NPDC001599]|uniref:hypothetical protein n=1 Tax=Streptomyces sp. NPDC001599 TaxID=3364591 RepID=UPI00367829E8